MSPARSWRDRGCALAFAYEDGWLERDEALPLGAAVPLRAGVQQSPAIDAFFENLLPEGCMREAAADACAVPPGDVFSLLAAFGANGVGAVEVWTCNPPTPAVGHRPVALSSTGSHRVTANPHPSRPALPEVHVDIRVADVRSLAVKALGHTILPGSHRKIPLRLTSERRRAKTTPGAGRHILKPQSTAPFVPENEFVTLRIAAAAGVEVVACSLVTIADGSRALLTRRFDRPDAGGKLRVEDFCQLAGRRPSEKYDGSAEFCADVVRRHASEPVIDIARLFRRFVVAWWTGNAGLHLKKLALLTGSDGVVRLAPAYGLRCAPLAGDDGTLALPVSGKYEGLCRADWLRLADSCALRRPAAERVLREVSGSLDAGLAIVADSPLPDSAKAVYANLLRARARHLA
jgi:serine/threonine-protein kinase HipA